MPRCFTHRCSPPRRRAHASGVLRARSVVIPVPNPGGVGPHSKKQVYGPVWSRSARPAGRPVPARTRGEGVLTRYDGLWCGASVSGGARRGVDERIA